LKWIQFNNLPPQLLRFNMRAEPLYIMRLGEIIQVTSAETYVVRLADENFGCLGQFVSISTPDATIIGVITGITHSAKEDMVGYLSQDRKIKYQPYIEDYKNSYAVIHGLGRLSCVEDGGGDCGGVRYTIDKPPHLDDAVETAPRDDIVRFHTIQGRPGAAYLHALHDRLPLPVILNMIGELERAIPASSGMLNLVRRYAGQRMV